MIFPVWAAEVQKEGAMAGMWSLDGYGGEEGGQGTVCECLRGALKEEEENKGNAVTGEGNKKKKNAALH